MVTIKKMDDRYLNLALFAMKHLPTPYISCLLWALQVAL
jgi:hypothetical protein